MGNLVCSRVPRKKKPVIGVDVSGKPKVYVVNKTSLPVTIWFNGGGPVGHIGPNETRLVRALTEAKRCKWQAIFKGDAQGCFAVLAELTVVADPLELTASLTIDALGADAELTLLQFNAAHVIQRYYRARPKRILQQAERKRRGQRFRAAVRIQRRARPFIDKLQRPCPICLETKDWRALVRTTRTGHPMLTPGHHLACAPCMASYCEHEMTEGKIYVRCPAENCHHLLSKEDLRRHCTSARAFSAYSRRLAEMHNARLCKEEDASFIAFCAANARKCPACSVVILRSVGCDSMLCSCGHAFNYQSPSARITGPP